MQELNEFGIRLIQTLQTLSPALDGLMLFFSFLGQIEFYLLALPFIYWNVNTSLGFRVTTVLLLTETVTVVCKLLFHAPRPYWVGGVTALQTEESYGIPSGHASGAVAVWGYLAVYVRARWFRILAVAIILLISLSRLYLAVHFPQDILGGWLVGLVVVWLFVLVEQRWDSRWAGQRMSTQIALGLALSLLLAVAGFASLAWIAAIADPLQWAAYAVEARDPEEFVMLSGALFGTIAGYALMCQYAGFATTGSWGQKLLRYFAGLVIVGIVYVGLDLIFVQFAEGRAMLLMALTWARYALTSLCGMFVAPWLFLRLRLALPLAE